MIHKEDIKNRIIHNYQKSNEELYKEKLDCGCYYCKESKVKYRTIYCKFRREEREYICDLIYETVLPMYRGGFTTSTEKQQSPTAKGVGKDANILARRGLWKLIAWPLSNIHISRLKDVSHTGTTVNEIKLFITNFRKQYGIDFEREMGLSGNVSANTSKKTMLSSHNTGFLFTGLDNANSRGGIKPLNGFFVEDIFDEPIEKDSVFDEDKNKKQEMDYQLFINTLNREDTDKNGKYIIYEDDYLPTYKVPITTSMVINNKIIERNRSINRKMVKRFSMSEFSNPYDSNHGTYVNSCKYLPYNEHLKALLKDDKVVIYEDDNNFVMRTGIIANPMLGKNKIETIEKNKEKDEPMYNLLRYGGEYEGTGQGYIYRSDMMKVQRGDRNSDEYKDFDGFYICSDIGGQTGDSTVYNIIGLKMNGETYKINHTVFIREIVYDYRKGKSLDSVERMELLYETIEGLNEEYPNSKVNPYADYNKEIIVVFPKDGEGCKGFLGRGANDTGRINIDILQSITIGDEWSILPRQYKTRCLLSSGRLKINGEDAPVLYKELWNAVRNPSNGKRFEPPNSFNSTNALEGGMSRFLPFMEGLDGIGGYKDI